MLAPNGMYYHACNSREDVCAYHWTRAMGWYAILNGDEKSRLPGNVNFCFKGTEAEGLLLLLDNKGICASSGSACTSGFLDPSHVLLAIGRDKETARGSLRLTLDYENTKEEVEMIIKAVAETVKILRGE